MKLKSILLTAVATVSLATATMAQVPTQQWITTLNMGSTAVDAFDGCNFSDFRHYAKRIAVSSDNSRVGVNGMSGCDVYTAVVDATNGNSLLSNSYALSGNDAGLTIVPDVNNNFVASGMLAVTNFSPHSPTALLRKVGTNNSILFDTLVLPTSPATRINLTDLATDNAGNIYGYGLGYSGSAELSVLHKFNPTGTLLWRSIINDYDWYYGYPGALTLDPSGNAIFTGKRQTTSSQSTYDIVVRKVDPSGTQLWQIYYHVGEDYIHNITTDAQGDIYFTMEARNVENRVVKLSGATGNVLWSTQYNSGASVGGNVKINANGNVLVRYTQTKAFDASTGALLWISNTNGYRNDTDSNSRIYSVANNKIYIINGNGTFSDSITVAIPNFTVTLRDIVVSGNSFYVTGKRVNGSDSKIFVAKYNSQSCTATITAGGATTFCQGDSVVLNANSGAGLSYQWQNNGTNITGATAASYTANATGSYTVIVIDGNFCSATSTATAVSVNPTPTVSFLGLSNFTNYDDNPLTVNGNPSGGSFTGPGMSGTSFNPQTAGLGSATITYSFTNVNGCSNTSSQITIVYDTLGVVCTSYDTLLTTVTDTLIINTTLSVLLPPNNVNTIKVYPNPASTHITIDYGDYTLMNGYTLQIVNTMGQTMYTTPINQQSSYIDLTTWTGNGLYFVQIIDPQSNVIENRKIVLQ